MSERIGGVHFTASIDGRRTPADAERIGRQAGAAGAEGFDDEWSDSFTEAMDKSMKDAVARWRRSGREGGLGYGDAFSRSVQRTLRRTLWRNLMGSVGGLTNTVLEGTAGLRVFRQELVNFGDEMTIAGDRTRAGLNNALEATRTRADNVSTSMRGLGANVSGRVTQSFTDLRDRVVRLNGSFDGLRDRFPGLFSGFDYLRGHLLVVRDRVQQAGESVTDFGRRMRGLLPDSDAMRGALQAVRTSVDDLGRAYRSTSDGNEEFRRSLSRSSTDNKLIASTAATAANSISGLGSAARRSGIDADDASFRWKSLGYNVRQFILIAGAIIGAGENIAVLGSAAGAGILVLGGAIAQTIPGIVAMVATFQGLSGDLNKLPESVRPAAQAFQDLKIPIQEVQDSIQSTALRDAEKAFRSFGDTIRALEPAFQPLAGVINRAIGGLAEELKPGHRAFNDLYKLIEQSAPTFEKVLGIVGKLAGALVTAFVNPEVQRSIDEVIAGVDGMVDSFDNFVQSSGLDEWMQNARTIFGELGGLLTSVGDMLNNLVDQESVDRTAAFIDALDRSMPFFESLLEFSGALNIFGIAGQALATLGEILSPVLDVLTPIAGIFSEIIITMMRISEVIWSVLSPALIPLQIIWEGLRYAVEKLVEWMQPIIDKFAEVGESGKTLGDQIVTEVMPDIQGLIDSFIDLLPPPEEVAAFIEETLIPTLRDIAHWIMTDVIPAVRNAIQSFNDMVDALGGWDGIKSKVIGVANGFLIFKDIVLGAMYPVINVIQGVISLIDRLNNKKIITPTVAGSGGGGGGGMASGGLWSPAMKMAVGGILSGPRVLAGEAGAEALVPLQRPLAAVDPSVRWLSAIAQGKALYTGGSSSSRTVEVQAGAFQIITPDSRKAAVEAIDRLVEVSED